MRKGDLYRFGPFILDADERVLLRDGRVVPLPPKALSTLLVLVRRTGHLVEKDVLMNEVWPGKVVEEGNLAQHIFMLRRALGETSTDPKYLETVPRRGYRFLAKVETRSDAAAPDLGAQAADTAPEAFRAYVRGRYHWNKYTHAGLNKAIGYFQQAIEVDPAYALAYVGIADSFFRLSTTHLPPLVALPKAKAAALRALEIDPLVPEALASLGMVKMRYEWDWEGAGNDFTKAIELNPAYVTAHLWYGEYFESQGRFEDALTHIRLAFDLDPLSWQVLVNWGICLWKMRLDLQALHKLKEAVAMDPNHYPARLALAVVQGQLGNYSESLKEFERARRLDDSLAVVGILGQVYATSGRDAEARRVLKRLQEQRNERYVSAYCVALIYAALAEQELAFEWLEKAFEDRDEFLTWGLASDPRLDNLRADQRIDSLMKRIGLKTG